MVIRSLMLFSFLLAAAPALGEDKGQAVPSGAAAQNVTQKVIVQNELSKDATNITVRLSTQTDPRVNQIEQKSAFDIPAMGAQKEIDLSGDMRRYRWVQLSYRVNGGTSTIQTGAFVVSRRPPNSNRGHYIDQAILVIRVEDGSSSQCQLDEKPNPTGFETEPYVAKQK